MDVYIYIYKDLDVDIDTYIYIYTHFVCPSVHVYIPFRCNQHIAADSVTPNIAQDLDIPGLSFWDIPSGPNHNSQQGNPRKVNPIIILSYLIHVLHRCLGLDMYHREKD